MNYCEKEYAIQLLKTRIYVMDYAKLDIYEVKSITEDEIFEISDYLKRNLNVDDILPE